MSQDVKKTKVQQLVELIKELGPEKLRPTDYRLSAINAGMKAPSGTVIRVAMEQIFGKNKEKKAKASRTTKKNKIRTTVVKFKGVTTGSNSPLRGINDALSDDDKYDLLQVKEVAARVGGCERLIELANWLQNWQL